jgi:uncharacterized protein YjbK
MKKFIILLSLISLTSCVDLLREENNCYTGTLLILDKNSYSTKASTNYELYVYDGREAKWYDTTKKDYDSYEKNDTLPTLVLRTTKYVKE